MKLLIGVLLMTSACATPSDGRPRPQDRPGVACDPDKAGHLIGRAASAEIAAEAQRLAGAYGTRWLRPGDIVTMEYRDSRLNLKLDANDRIVAITCG